MAPHEDDHIDRLGEMFELQGNLQRETYGAHPSDIRETVFDGTQFPERVKFIKDMHIAIGDELSEFLGEIGWKPWATSRHINFEAARGELVDAFHFFMNLCMAVDMTPDMLYERYKAKRLKNIKRQEEGYDGVSTKCPHCKRALDDEAVNCREIQPGPNDRWNLKDGDIAIQCSMNGGIYVGHAGESISSFYRVKPSAIGASE